MNSFAAERVYGPSLSFIQWQIQERGSGDQGPRLIFIPNWGPKCRKKFFGDLHPPFIWKIAPPSYLKVWIRHCHLPPKILQYITYAVTLRRHGRAEAGEHKLEHILLLKVH